MPAVFVHGNPETAAIWGPLLDALSRDDVITLSPPGFGAPVPDGFGATMDEYRDWLIHELEAIDGPVDLVGHDWGGGHTTNVALARPDLIRSWCTDIAGAAHPDYQWHDMAQVWISEEGEAAVAGMVDTPVADRAELYQALGMSPEVAADVAAAANADMARCILALYRSAAQPVMADAGARFGELAGTPGLVIRATEDHYVGTDDTNREMAERAGARFTVLDGVGHWWMCQDPAAGAAALDAFWAELD